MHDVLRWKQEIHGVEDPSCGLSQWRPRNSHRSLLASSLKVAKRKLPVSDMNHTDKIYGRSYEKLSMHSCGELKFFPECVVERTQSPMRLPHCVMRITSSAHRTRHTHHEKYETRPQSRALGASVPRRSAALACGRALRCRCMRSQRVHRGLLRNDELCTVSSCAGGERSPCA